MKTEIKKLINDCKSEIVIFERVSTPNLKKLIEIVELITSEDNILIINAKEQLTKSLRENINHLRIDRSDIHHDIRDYDRLNDAEYEEISVWILNYLNKIL